jgi:hypothetical protein
MNNFKIIYSMHFESIFFSFNVPTKCTYSTWYYSHHCTPTCFGMTMPSSGSKYQA